MKQLFLISALLFSILLNAQVGITVTQDLKTYNEVFKNDTINQIHRFGSIPKSFAGISKNYQRTDGYHHLTDIHEADGFYNVVTPNYNSETEKLGALYFNVNEFTYNVIAKTDQEIQNELTNKSEDNKQALIQAKLEAQVIAEAQNSDDTESLDNQDLFPFWEFPFDYTLDYKVQAFNNDNELKLYKCVQAHTSQEDWQPKDVPALFTVVAYPNEIPVFVQPTGAQDAYQTGDQVHYPTISDPVYESLIDANVWSPDAFPAGWQLIP